MKSGWNYHDLPHHPLIAADFQQRINPQSSQKLRRRASATLKSPANPHGRNTQGQRLEDRAWCCGLFSVGWNYVKSFEEVVPRAHTHTDVCIHSVLNWNDKHVDMLDGYILRWNHVLAAPPSLFGCIAMKAFLIFLLFSIDRAIENIVHALRFCFLNFTGMSWPLA